jgi:hypothetical protein
LGDDDKSHDNGLTINPPVPEKISMVMYTDGVLKYVVNIGINGILAIGLTKVLAD